MAIKLTGNYAKRLGLPGYSSHQFSVSIETELTDLSQVEDEVARTYRLLQDAVDREIQETGFVPDEEYGLRHNVNLPASNGKTNGNGGSNGNGHPRLNGGNTHGNGNGHNVRWSCSDKQKELILKLVNENDLDRDTVEEISLDRFGVGVKQLNKLQASGLIAELIELSGKSNSRQGNGNGNGRKGAKR
jgi:hypothetical protein